MAYKPGSGAPPPQAPASKSKKRKEKTPGQVAARSIAISQAREQLTHSGFNSAWNQYNEIYQAYAGRNATKSEATYLISNGVSRTTLAQHLAKQPAFYKSPIWKANSDALIGVAKNIGMKVDRKFVAQAIANNWSEANFSEKLRKLPSYLQSNEFKTTTAGLTNAYRNLYGDPGDDWKQEIQRVALARWTPDQWLMKLRADPNYRNSSEYQSKLSGIRQLLGYLPSGETRPPIGQQ
jgi:hypothetical protein